MGWEQDIEAAVATAASAAAEAVVTLGTGSGLVIGAGRVVTNAHNVRAEDMPVRFADGRVATARTAGADLDGDLAVLDVDTGGIDVAAPSAAPVRLGQPVVVLARPRHRGLVATVGTVAATEARFRGPRGGLVVGAFEHDARLPRGASGGPVLDTAGRLLGINTHRRRDGFYVAMPTSADLLARIDGLAEGIVPPRARLGIAVAPPHVARRLRAAVGLPERDGVLVREVDEDGTAAAAGIASGDLLVAVDGTELRSVDDLQAVLAGAGSALELTVVRGTDERTVVVDVHRT